MTDELRVTPDALRLAGEQIDRCGRDLAATQHRWHTETQEARSGWVGRSAAALAALLDGWSALGRAQLQRIGDQAHALAWAAEAFAAADDYPTGTAGVGLS